MREAERFLISDEEFEAFLDRHREVSCLVPESNQKVGMAGAVHPPSRLPLVLPRALGGCRGEMWGAASGLGSAVSPAASSRGASEGAQCGLGPAGHTVPWTWRRVRISGHRTCTLRKGRDQVPRGQSRWEYGS